jgi:hypothetical protein
MKKTKGRDPQKALESKMKLVSEKIQKILIDNELALHPFIQFNQMNGAQTPQVRLISTKQQSNAIETGNKEPVGEDKDKDGAPTAE